MVGADLQPPLESIDSPNFAYHKSDVTSWTDLCNLFASVHQKHGHINVVFANAGIGPWADLFNLQQDDEGIPVEPTKLTLQVNLKSVVNTVFLATHYLQQQEPKGGRIVLTASVRWIRSVWLSRLCHRETRCRWVATHDESEYEYNRASHAAQCCGT